MYHSSFAPTIGILNKITGLWSKCLVVWAMCDPTLCCCCWSLGWVVATAAFCLISGYYLLCTQVTVYTTFMGQHHTYIMDTTLPFLLFIAHIMCIGHVWLQWMGLLLCANFSYILTIFAGHPLYHVQYHDAGAMILHPPVHKHTTLSLSLSTTPLGSLLESNTTNESSAHPSPHSCTFHLPATHSSPETTSVHQSYIFLLKYINANTSTYHSDFLSRKNLPFQYSTFIIQKQMNFSYIQYLLTSTFFKNPQCCHYMDCETMILNHTLALGYGWGSAPVLMSSKYHSF